MTESGTDLAASEKKARLLDRALVGGLAWTAGVRWTAQLLSWSSTIVIAHHLTRADYGIIGAATVYLGLVQLVNEFGVGVAIVRERDLDERHIASLGGLSILLGVFFFLFSAVLAHPLALFFHEQAVANVVLALSSTFIITGFRVLPNSLLAREREFRRMARIDGMETICQTLTTLTLAMLGYGFWAIVAGSIVAATVSTVLNLAARPHRLSWPRDYRPLIEPLRMGWQVTVSRVTWYLYSNADFAVVGRVLGKIANGAYTMSWQIANIPVDKTSGILSRVTLPVFSQVQNDPKALSRYVRGLSEFLALLTFPLTIGLALVVRDFVPVVLGPEWVASIIPMRLLLLYSGFRSLMTLLPNVLIAIGDSRRTMWVSILSLLVMPPAFYVGTHWGPSGVAFAWLIVYPMVVIPFLLLPALRAIGMKPIEYLGALWPAICGCLVMIVAVELVTISIPPGWHDAGRLAIRVAAGAAAYATTLWLGFRGRAYAIWAQFRPKPEPAPAG